LTTTARLSTSTTFDFQINDVSRALKFLMLVLGREGSSWDEMGKHCDDVKQAK